MYKSTANFIMMTVSFILLAGCSSPGKVEKVFDQEAGETRCVLNRVSLKTELWWGARLTYLHFRRESPEMVKGFLSIETHDGKHPFNLHPTLTFDLLNEEKPLRTLTYKPKVTRVFESYSYNGVLSKTVFTEFMLSKEEFDALAEATDVTFKISDRRDSTDGKLSFQQREQFRNFKTQCYDEK